MQESLKFYKESQKIDSELTKVLKFANFFVAKVKNNLVLNKLFCQVFESEDAFISDIKKENLKKTCQALLEFILETLPERPDSISAQKLANPSSLDLAMPEIQITPSASDCSKSSIFQMCGQSDLLAQNISIQKQKIFKIYESVRESINKSKNVLGTPRLEHNFSSSPLASDAENYRKSTEPVQAKKTL